MSYIVTFSNHSPIRISSADDVKTIWSRCQQWGWHCIDSYTTTRGKVLYWSSFNAGTDKSGTKREYLPNVAAIKAHFAEHDITRLYHAECEEHVDPQAILDVDAL